MKYLTSGFEATKNSNNELVITFKERELHTPKNIVDATTFEAVLVTILENDSLKRLEAQLAIDIKAENSEAIALDEAAIEVFKTSRHVVVNPSNDTDASFYNALKWCAVGIDKKTETFVNNDENSVVNRLPSIMAKALVMVHNNKAVSVSDMKVLKELCNEFANKYMATSNESGVFKKFHVDFSTKSIMQIVTKLEGRVKWTAKEGFSSKVLNTDEICLEILRRAADSTFKFSIAPKAQKAVKKVL